MHVLVIHGPNLNLLGQRQPEIYGSMTLAELNDFLTTVAHDHGITIDCVQYNGEGEIINAIHDARSRYDGIVINPGAYSHYSYAIADAISSLDIPVIEAHLSNIAARETYRRVSVTAAACIGSISGFGQRSYALALRVLAERAEN
ncbi:MAG TPA: type II 3-dehydroquinate dehydratase [Candidatus Baltobacteraceae bacterium]|nr:type II 3-dehydroquinate dehydratase [Candidatus Baltobacteraceae bacterium]